MKEVKHIKILIAITIIAGAIGGIGNYFMIDIKPKNAIGLIKPIIMGIIASAVLPLFLKLASSNILDYVEEHLRYKNYIYFVSLCLLAALFADVFLKGIYAKVFNEVSEEIAVIEQKIENSNEKVDYALYNIKTEKTKTLIDKKSKTKDEEIRGYQKALNLDKMEATVYYEIKTNKISDNKELYKLGSPEKIDNTVTKLKKNNLVKEFEVDKTKMIVPKNISN
ncbi:hypothetical protein GCM10022291_24660 [Postechiella marina]|uniref:YEATS-Like-Associating Three TM domain-containing protein n=1 Tax=Postechiella marina TaxID=943941 RepID=A0ABP8CCE4_9FLAO